MRLAIEWSRAPPLCLCVCTVSCWKAFPSLTSLHQCLKRQHQCFGEGDRPCARLPGTMFWALILAEFLKLFMS